MLERFVIIVAILLAGLLAGLFAGSSAVFAAEAAERDIIGFSPDGRWFAFEEYGVQDGSGFPYSNIYVIDLDADRWAEGTPIRVVLNDGELEPPPLHAARAAAREQASDTLESLDIGYAGRLLASNPVTEEVQDPTVMRFRLHYNGDSIVTLRLETFPLDPAEPCPDPELEPVGFAISAARDDDPRRDIHRDRSLPASRGCPLDYRLADVIAYDVPGAPARYVVLVQRLSFGFEGPDARFLALPAELP